MSDDLSPLGRELMSLERAQPSGLEPGAEAAARVFARLEAAELPPAPAEPPAPPQSGPATAMAPGAAAAGATAGLTVGKVGVGLALLTVGGLVGSAATLLVERLNAPPPPPAVQSPPVVPVVIAPVPEARPVVEISPPVPTAPRPAEPASTLRQEQVLLDTARAAIVSQRYRDALATLKQHLVLFPSGVLAEQREALAVQALGLVGDVGAARQRASAFARKYPQSVFLPAVEAATPEP